MEKNVNNDSNAQPKSTQENTGTAGNGKKSRGQKKNLTPDKLKPHYVDETIKLNDLYYSFYKEELEEILQRLNRILGNAAVTMTADEYTELKIHIDMDKFRTITTRKAGRKKSNVKLEEVMEYSKTHTSMETAEWLGLTRQTYYRKLKEHRENSHDGKTEF